MNAISQRHVETDKQNLTGNELDSQVQTMKPAIAAPPNCPEFQQLELVIRLIQEDLLDVPWTALTKPVHRKLEPLEVHRPAILLPPSEITSIKNVSIGDELDRIVDNDPGKVNSLAPCYFFDLVEVDLSGAGAASDDNHGLVLPLGPPGGSGVASRLSKGAAAVASLFFRGGSAFFLKSAATAIPRCSYFRAWDSLTSIT